MNNETYNYKQTLDIVENFMNESGIRWFCTKTCKGQCCNTLECKDMEECITFKEKKLACAIFICLPLKTIILNKHEFSVVTKCNEEIKRDLLIAKNKKNANLPWNMYSSKYLDKTKNRFKIEKSTMNELKKLNTREIDNKFYWLTELYKPVLMKLKTK